MKERSLRRKISGSSRATLFFYLTNLSLSLNTRGLTSSNELARLQSFLSPIFRFIRPLSRSARRFQTERKPSPFYAWLRRPRGCDVFTTSSVQWKTNYEFRSAYALGRMRDRGEWKLSVSRQKRNQAFEKCTRLSADSFF